MEEKGKHVVCCYVYATNTEEALGSFTQILQEIRHGGSNFIPLPTPENTFPRGGGRIKEWGV